MMFFGLVEAAPIYFFRWILKPRHYSRLYFAINLWSSLIVDFLTNFRFSFFHGSK